MDKEEIRTRGCVVSYLNGFLNLFSFFNLHQGKDSLGDKIIDYTNNSGIINNSYAFAAGFLTELTTEIAVPIYIASASDSIRWYHVLLADLAIKTIPRGLERLVNLRENKFDEDIISKQL